MKLSDYDGNNEQARYSPGSFSVIEKEALYKAILSRRDVRSHFTESKDVPMMFYGEYWMQPTMPHQWDFHNHGTLL